MATIQCDWTIFMEFTPGVETDVSADVLLTPDLRFMKGSTSAGPTDRLGAAGTFEFSLRNDSKNSGGLQGYYSPGHVNCRSGFFYGIKVRLAAVYQATPHTVWRGRLRTILPDSGQHGPRQTHCTAQDVMADLVDARVQSISPQINKAEDDLITALIDSLATELTSSFTLDLDAGLDVVPYAFDNLGAGSSAFSALRDVVVSALGWCYFTAAGTLVYENRHTRLLKASQHSFSDTDGLELAVQSSVDDAANRVQVTYHPKTVDLVDTTVLYSAPNATSVSSMQTVTVRGTYFDPTNTVKLIGGTDVHDGTLTTADYTANSIEDGSGVDLSASVTVVATGFASTVMFEITNHGTNTAFVTPQVRGRGIYDNGAITVESFSSELYGDKSFELDLPFQNNGLLAQDMADYILNVVTSHRVLENVMFKANVSDTMMVQALTREVGDVITLSETVTGVTSVKAAIQGVEGIATDGGLTMTWYLVSQNDTPGFVLDDAVNGILDTSTLGYA